MADEELKEKLNNLTNSDIIQNDRLDEHDDELQKIHEILDGDPKDRNDDGLKGDVKEMIRRQNKLEALMAPDSLGEGGIINRLKRLEKNSGFVEKESENRWKLWIAIVGLVGALAATIIPNLDRIEKFLEPRSSLQPAPKKRKVVKRVIRQVPAPEIPASE